MDIFRRLLGLPRREEQIPFTPRNEIPPEGLFIPEEQFEDYDENIVRHGLHSQIDQEFQEMERQFRDLWSVFGMGPDIFNEGFKNLFEGFGGMPPAIAPGESVPSLPSPQEDDSDLRHKMLKPSLVTPPKSSEERKDQDLDSRVKEEGLAALIEEKNDRVVQPPSRVPQFKSFSRSVSIQTYRKADGTMETRKVVRDSEGNEEVTITEHSPDGSPIPQHPGTFDPLHPGTLGRFPTHPGFFGSPNQDHPDQRGLDIFGKIFGPRF